MIIANVRRQELKITSFVLTRDHGKAKVVTMESSETFHSPTPAALQRIHFEQQRRIYMLLNSQTLAHILNEVNKLFGQ